MDTLRKNLESHFDNCLPSIKKEFAILIDKILEDADIVDAEQNYDNRVKGIYKVMEDAQRIFKLDGDLKTLMNKK